eukprot:CAMPEP_0174277286 /NCGR_PEP_ID=MMETSP0439-20130205/60850_1 /TAXON_ID=0 /ORGANISM="Stereomyxa ramosa, Strain Chinc5" /LENGTH=434 /DNA_ID=CAMNT_0015369595 /DNA_START=1143 /DNA_END=2444 /DNA_ORIENTATION=-
MSGIVLDASFVSLFKINLMPLILNIEFLLLLHVKQTLLNFQNLLRKDAKNKHKVYEKKKSVDDRIEEWLQTQVLGSVFVSKFIIEELSLELSIQLNVGIFLGSGHTPLCFSAVHLHNFSATPTQLFSEIAPHYVADSVLRTPAILGSLELLGNPTGIMRAMGSGVYDLVYQPIHGMQEGGISGLVGGIGRGTSSLLLSTTHALLSSLSGLSSNLGRNVDMLSFDEDHILQQAELRSSKAQHFGGEIGKGLEGLGRGVVGGLFGLISQPLYKCKERYSSSGLMSGVGGFGVGVGIGVLGVVCKPVSGALSLIEHTSSAFVPLLSSNLFPLSSPKPFPIPKPTPLYYKSKFLSEVGESRYLFYSSIVVVGHDGTLSTASIVLSPSFLSLIKNHALVQCVAYKNFTDLRLSNSHNPNLNMMQIQIKNQPPILLLLPP